MTLPPPPGPAQPHDPLPPTPPYAEAAYPPAPVTPSASAPYPPAPTPPHASAPYPPSQGQWAYPPPPQVAAPASSLYLAAAIINWVVMAMTILFSAGIGIFVAAWFVPMTIYIHRGAKDGYKHTGLAVCTLLFCGLVSGILMLVDEGNRVPRDFR